MAPPASSRSSPRGKSTRGARRADRRADRRRRAWRIVAVVGAVLVLGAGGAAAAAMLMDDDASTDTASVARRSPVSTVPTTARSTTTTTPGLPCRSLLTPEAPLRLWIAGDSIAHSVGNGLGKRAAATGVVAPVYESRVSSGLSTPGFFDWPKRAGEELPRLDPEVVVFVMGTNDWTAPQATPVDSSGQPAWKATYARQVKAMVDALTANGRTLYWVGPPVLRDSKQEAGVREVAAVIRPIVDAHPTGVFVDLHDLLDAEDASYTPFVEVAGKRIQVRSGDGVHLTEDGGDYVGDALFELVDTQCRVKAQAVAGKKQPLVETRGSTSVGSGGSASVTPGGTATAPPTTPATVGPTTPPPTTPPTVPPTTTPTVPPTTPPTVPPTTPPTTGA